jgi:SAM-dependent methyltransferase
VHRRRRPVTTGDQPAVPPPDRPTAMNSATGKRLLALVRDADYAHPGEEEANRLLFSGFAPDPRRRILDAGCGSAGTAAWLQHHGLGVVTGIELDAETVRLARLRHPEVTVVEGDLQRAAEALPGPFDLVYSMTALYAVPGQNAAFAQLGALAAPGAELRLLEYSDPHGRFARAAAGRRSWEWWRPLDPAGLPDVLSAAGWVLGELRDLEAEFTRWYEVLCARIAEKETAIVREFGRQWFAFASRDYAGILQMVRAGDLGGVLVRAAADRRHRT